jgi:hypothetical protein
MCSQGTRKYCDVLLESRNIGARVYDRFLDNGLAKRLHNRIAPVSIQRKHLYNSKGMLLRYNAGWKRFRYNGTLIQRVPKTREKTFSPGVSAQIAINQRTVLRKQSTEAVLSSSQQVKSSKTVLELAVCYDSLVFVVTQSSY